MLRYRVFATLAGMSALLALAVVGCTGTGDDGNQPAAS